MFTEEKRLAHKQNTWISPLLGEVAVILFLAFLFACGGAHKYNLAGELTGGILAIPLVLGLLFVAALVAWWLLHPQRPGVWELVRWMFRKRWVWLLLLLTVLLRLPSWGTWPQDDGMEYYTALYNACSNFQFDAAYIFQNFRLANHPTWGMALLAAIPEFFMPGDYNSFWVFHTAISLAMVAVVYDLLIPYRRVKPVTAFLAALVVGSTPMFLGLTPHVSVEPALGAFFLCMVWAYDRGYCLLLAFTCALTAFSKELGIVLVAGFFIGVFARELWLYRKRGVGAALRRLLQKPANALMVGLCLVGGVFLLWYLFDPNLGWYARAVQGEQSILSIALDPAYAWEKVQEYLFTNFDWLLILLCILCLVLRFHKKPKKGKKRRPLPSYLTGILMAIVLFQLVSILAVTYTITRYNLAPELALAFLCVTLICLTLQGNAKNLVLGILTVLLTVQSYLTVDPLMKLVYPQIDTGAVSMVRVKANDHERHMSHYVIYNNQYSYLYRGLREIFKLYSPGKYDLIVLGTDGFIYLQGQLWDPVAQDYAVVFNNYVASIATFETSGSFERALAADVLKEKAILLCSPTYADETLTPEEMRAMIPSVYTNVEQHEVDCGLAGKIVYFTADFEKEAE